MKSYAALVAFILICVGGGTLIGLTSTPDGWYEGLAKPSFNPPNWIFGPVWTTLYVLIGIAGWRTFRREGASSARAVWVVQLLLNFAWSPVFFTLHAIGLALAVILAILGCIFLFIALTWRDDRTSALLFLPYAAWVAFASLLNGAIYGLN